MSQQFPGGLKNQTKCQTFEYGFCNTGLTRVGNIMRLLLLLGKKILVRGRCRILACGTCVALALLGSLLWLLVPSWASDLLAQLSPTTTMMRRWDGHRPWDQPGRRIGRPELRGLPLCPEVSPLLRGRMPALTIAHLHLAPPSLGETRAAQPGGLRRGGHYRPPNCEARHRTAVVVPSGSRDRVRLRVLLRRLHGVLQRQQLEYTVYVVQQVTDGPFYRAWLLNVGVREALSDAEFECLVMHDVDLLPENDRNLYTCEPQLGPKHLAVAIDKFRYKLPYESYFGGVAALTPGQYMRINGFPSNHWGRGADDEIANSTGQ
ncbi:beta-1,4-galactosyltransferase 3-like isoform X2 [Petromyzon marinus]|uniref:beta-1,4-galactosyltransferase 3-like isoform X2 n=1 Tax=Petromyzon marinus TaxID=7757 RepID=UPI003F72818F